MNDSHALDHPACDIVDTKLCELQLALESDITVISKSRGSESAIASERERESGDRGRTGERESERARERDIYI
jgi:hypothetical protein